MTSISCCLFFNAFNVDRDKDSALLVAALGSILCLGLARIPCPRPFPFSSDYLLSSRRTEWESMSFFVLSFVNMEECCYLLPVPPATFHEHSSKGVSYLTLDLLFIVLS